MDILKAAGIVGPKFRYKSDKKLLMLFDVWFIMREKDGYLYGDCEDFALTCLWEACDRNLKTFFKKVILTHEYKLYYVKTKDNGNHVVGCAENLWFDNWTRWPYKKDIFFNITKHTDAREVPSFDILFFMLCGLFRR